MCADHFIKMVLNIITAAYFLSLIVMAVCANIRPIYYNPWNKTEYLEQLNDTETPLDYIDILTVANQVAVAVFGKRIAIIL